MPVESKTSIQTQDIPFSSNPFSLNPKASHLVWSPPPILPVMPQYRSQIPMPQYRSQKESSSIHSSSSMYPRLRRTVSHIGKNQGFDVFSPAVPDSDSALTTDETLPSPPELDYRLDFNSALFDSPFAMSSSPLPTLDFTCVDSSEDVVLGAIPIASPLISSLNSPFIEQDVDNKFLDTSENSATNANSNDADMSDTEDNEVGNYFPKSDSEKENIFHESFAASAEFGEHDAGSRTLRNGKQTVVSPPPKTVEQQAILPPKKEEPVNPEDSVIVIGEYTRAERRRKIQRFKAKQKNRNFAKKIIYKCRQTFAQSRPRVGGRFISAASA